MPNRVINMIDVQGDPRRINEMREAIQNDECGLGTIDFNKIAPMPPSLEIECGTRTDRGVKAVRDFLEVYGIAHPDETDISKVPIEIQEAFLSVRPDIDREDWELGKQAYMNQLQYGAQTWYGWAIDNWGTKWNAYGYDGTGYENGNGLYCQTAWSAPHPIMAKLAEMYPDLTFTHEWADEDLGSNCGRTLYANGQRVSVYIPEGKEALEFACNVWDYDLQGLGYELNVLGTDYVYTEMESFKLADLFGKPALFTDEKLTAADIPRGLFCYYLNNNMNGEPYSVSLTLTDRFAGCVVTDEPLEFDGQTHLTFDENNLFFIIGDGEMSFREYMNGEFNGLFNDVTMG